MRNKLHRSGIYYVIPGYAIVWALSTTPVEEALLTDYWLLTDY